MKNILLKIFFGFLFGIGFSGAFILGINIFEKVMMMDNSYMHPPSYDESAKLVIQNHTVRKVGTGIVVIGTIENQGNSTWSFVKIETEMFDDEGNFVDECNGTTSATLAPKQQENFKIVCENGCLKDMTPLEIGRSTIKITGAMPKYDIH